MRVEIKRWKLADGDRLLLCSDGLTDMVDDDHIAEVLAREAGSDETCRLLVESALENGGKDNITVVLARYGIPSRACVSPTPSRSIESRRRRLPA